MRSQSTKVTVCIGALLLATLILPATARATTTTADNVAGPEAGEKIPTALPIDNKDSRVNPIENMIAGNLGPTAEKMFPDTYAGIIPDPETHGVILYFTPGSIPSPDSAERQALIRESTLSPEQIRFDTSPVSYTQLKATIHKVMADRAQLEALGIQVFVASIDLEKRKVLLRVISPSIKQQDTLRNLYGGDSLEIMSIEDDEKPRPADRQNDFAPFNGGIFASGQKPFIDGSPNGVSSDCSLGFSTHAPNGGTYLVTAAHCFANNTKVYNKSGAIPWGNGAEIGFVSNRSQEGAAIDAELIFGRGSSLVFTGFTYGATARALSGGAGTGLNDGVCQSGAFEGEVCGFSTTETYTCYVLPYLNSSYQNVSQTYCDGVTVRSTNPQAVGEGDSGGPVLKYYPGPNGTALVYAGGVVSALIGSRSRCIGWYPQVPRTCAPSLIYTSWAAISEKWALRIP